MGPEVEDMLAEHNAEALNNFLTYIRGYVLANAAALPHGNVLPMSGLSYPAAAACVPDVLGPSNFASEPGGALREYQKEVVIASPFVALSGMWCTECVLKLLLKIGGQQAHGSKQTLAFPPDPIAKLTKPQNLHVNSICCRPTVLFSHVHCKLHELHARVVPSCCGHCNDMRP